MSKDTSLDALINHINELESSERLTKAKANGWKTACRSLIRSLSGRPEQCYPHRS